MADEPQKPFKRSWFRFPVPRKQVMLFLPTVLVLAVLAVLVAFSVHRVQSRALEVLSTQGVSSDASREFLQQTHGFSLVISLVTAGVGLVAIVWVWWLSVWIFGPYRRLERDLNEVLYGRMDPDKIKVRKSDALFPLVERFRHALTKKPPQDPPSAK
jgi:hypothetical protein